MSDDLRDRLRVAVGGVLFNVTNFPERVQSRLLGQDMGPLNKKLTDAILPLLREAQEAAWDEGLSAGADRWMDSREFGEPPVNPYRVSESTEP